MLRARRRPAALVAPLLLVLALSACGEQEGAYGSSEEGFDAVSVSGDVGTAPEVEWNSRMSASEVETETLVEGDGEALADGDQVLVNYFVGNGYTRSTTVDTFGEEAAGTLVTVGEEPAEPQVEEDVLNAFVARQVTEGLTRGTRLAVVADVENGLEVLSLPSLDVGNRDTLLVVIDILPDEVLAAPAGERVAKPAWAPAITLGAGRVPTALDFTGTPAPTKQLRSAALIEGTGEPVAKGDVIVVDYVGQVYGGAQPFDESFSADKEPLVGAIGLGQLVPGWDKELVGVPVGSRVVLSIPPADGYGAQGNEQAGIKGTDTLFFVIDVLAAA